ncbi:Dystrophin [Schistosoma japonicum]|nr:Dystrophin [Schistosoma japonicum]
MHSVKQLDYLENRRPKTLDLCFIIVDIRKFCLFHNVTPLVQSAMYYALLKELLIENYLRLHKPYTFEFIACLSPHESRWAQLLASLDRRAQAIREACGDTESVSHLVEKVVDQLVSRWSQLRDPQINCEDWPEKDIKDIENYVESTTKTSLLNSIPNNSLRYQQNSQSEVKRTTDGGHLSLPKATKISRFDMQPPPSPTGYRAEFETKAEELLNWLDNSAEILELITMARPGENIEELDQLFDEIEERWSYLDKLLIEANRQVRISNQSVEFQQEAAKIQALLAQSNEEELKLKNEEKSQVNEFESVTNEIKSQPNTEKEIDGAIINKKIEDIRLIITQVKDSISQPINISNPEDADEQLNNLNKMIKDFEATTHFLVDWEINSSSPSEGICTKWNETLQDLREQYETVCTELNARVNFLQDLSEQHELFLNQFEGIEKWLSDMTDYLDSVSRAHLPSVPVIQAQLQESCEALNDMKTLKPTLQKVDEVAHRLLEYFILTDTHTTTCKADSVDHLALINTTSTTSNTNNNYSTLLSTSANEFPTINSLTTLSSTTTPSTPTVTATSMPNTVQVDIEKLEIWMCQSKEQLSQFSLINDPNDLKNLENIIKVIGDKITENRPILAAIDTCSAVNLAGQSILDTEALLTKAHFADLESAVAAERERLMAAIYHLDDFKTVLNSEKRWFETVRTHNERVKSSNYSEISEITDDLESLDRLSREHTIDDEERLNKLANSLNESHVMSSAIMKELEKYKTELTSVKVEVDSTTDYLQNLLSHLRSVDERVVEVENSLLNIEDDLDDYFFNTQSKSDICILRDKLQTRLKHAKNLIKELDEMIEYKSLQPRTDCLTNRLETYKAQLQKVYLQLTHLCQENGTVGQVKQITNKLKLLTPPDKPELTTELFNEIEDHLNKVIMSKDIFQSQMDELEKNTKHNELLETPENQLKLRNLHTPEFIDNDYLLSINRLTDNLLKPGTKISSTLQNLAREIRIHFNGLINFNYYCLGSGTQLADSSLADNEHNTNNPPIETSISERKTLLQLFAQQRLYLETRLRDLIVTGGNDNSSDKLEDLLNLQSLWYETNEKLDKKFHGANLLEKKLIIAQQLLIDYTTTPTIELYDQCIKMITELEHTYGWKLTFDRERLKHRDYVDMSLNDLKNKFITGDPILNEGLLNVYEKQLQCTSRLLNCIQNDLEYCRDGLTSHLGAYMNTLEGELQSCNKSLTDSARILQEINDDIKLKRKNQTNQTYSANLENVNVIAQDNDEMIWLKVLLSTQKSRLDAYINEYELNRNDWFKRYELWQSFNEHLKDLKMTTNYLLTLQNENNQIELSNIENKIKDTCLEFNILRQHSSKLMSMNSTRIKAPVKQHSLPSSCNVFSTLTTSTLTTTASTITSFNSSNIDDKPPSVPPRRHSLYRGHGIQLIEHDHEFVRYELNRLENELLSLCRKYGTLNYVTQPLTLQTSNSFVHPEKSTNQSNQSQQTATNNEQSTENHINSGNNKPSGLVFSVKEIPVNFDNSSTSSMNTSKEHSLKGMQQQMIQSSDDIRTCLIGLNESIDWFIHESCLVPVNISDYIDRGKSFDYYMNESFWCTKSQTNQISVNNSINTSNGANEKLIEVNNTYVQLKLKELDNIEWKSMDWKNCINIFNDKSKILLKSKSLLNSNKELSKLEMINSKAQTILNLALNNLRKYREILYTFKTNLAKIEGSIRQIELIKNSIDDSDQIIQDLSINKWLKSLCQQITPHNSKRDGVATNEFIKELDPQYGKLGIQLILLGNLWNNAENHLDDLNKTVHNSMKFVYSASIENYVKEILNEWNNLSDTLQLTLTSSEFISSSSPTTKSENISRPIYSQDIFTKQTNNYDQNNDISLNSKALLENSVGNQRIKSLNESISSSGFLTNLLNDPCATTKETEIFESQSGPVVSNPTEANSIISTAICHESVLPLLNRMRSEVQQLTRWLTTIKNVLETSQAKLGDRFDQDTESQQLQDIYNGILSMNSDYILFDDLLKELNSNRK